MDTNSEPSTKNTIKLQKVPPAEATNVVDVQRILQGRKKITLQHQGDSYVLQVTSNNKLLLTK